MSVGQGIRCQPSTYERHLAVDIKHAFNNSKVGFRVRCATRARSRQGTLAHKPPAARKLPDLGRVAIHPALQELPAPMLPSASNSSALAWMKVALLFVSALAAVAIVNERDQL
jgi:hypothetical protein